jgi:hypothetical protein
MLKRVVSVEFRIRQFFNRLVQNAPSEPDMGPHLPFLDQLPKGRHSLLKRHARTLRLDVIHRPATDNDEALDWGDKSL